MFSSSGELRKKREIRKKEREIRKKAVSNFKKAAQEITSIFFEFSFDPDNVGRDLFKMDVKQIMENMPSGLVK